MPLGEHAAVALLGLRILADEGLLLAGVQEILNHRHRNRGIGDVSHRLVVLRSNADGRVFGTRRRSANQQRHGEALPSHFGGHMGHLVQRRRNQSAQSDQVGLLFNRRPQDCFGRHHDTQVDDVKVVAAQHDGNDVLSNIVDVTFDCGYYDGATCLSNRLGHVLFGRHEGRQIGDGLFHYPGRLDNLRQEHLAGTEQVAHDAHSPHQRTLDDLQRPPVLLPGVFRVGVDVVRDPFQQCMLQTFFHEALTPTLIASVLLPFRLLLDGLGQFDQTLGSVRTPVEQNVFDMFQQDRVNLFIDLQLSGIDDSHIEAGVDGVVQEGGVHGLSHHVVPSKGKRHIAESAGGLDAGTLLFDPPHRLDKGDTVIGVLFHAGAHGQDVGVKDDVFGGKPDRLSKQTIRPLCNGDLAFGIRRLAFLVESHDDGGRSVTAD